MGKPGALTPDEAQVAKEHTSKGVRIMEPIAEMKEIIRGIHFHHERFDGSGYPRGLKGTAIPLPGRIIAVADAFDAMTSDRPYRKKMSFAEARGIIIDGSGTQFDPRVVKGFLKAFPDTPTGKTRPKVGSASG